MIRLKDGVRLHGLTTQALLGIVILRDVFENDEEPFTITSVSDGKHGRKSLHQHGRAFDIRIHDLEDPQDTAILCAFALGDEWDVILESDHIHVEWDPKGKMGNQ
jgi:hypothetical protein